MKFWKTTPPPPKEESGDLVAVGTGQTSIDLDFQPIHLTYRVINDPCDPTPVSCTPGEQDLVVLALRPKGSGWELFFEYKVAGVKKILWHAKAQ